LWHRLFSAGTVTGRVYQSIALYALIALIAIFSMTPSFRFTLATVPSRQYRSRQCYSTISGDRGFYKAIQQTTMQQLSTKTTKKFFFK